MKITNQPSEAQGPNRPNVQAAQRVNKPTPPERPVAAQRTAPSDKVNISGKGREVADIIASVNQLPDIREAKVQEIKKSVDSGTYNIDARKIADRMLKDL